jgi:glutathione S-transferase
MLKLYQLESCPYCARVRSKMSELGIDYEKADVPRDKSQRTELIDLCGKPGVPTMVCEDGSIIADDDDAIVAYLEEHYSKK